MYFFVFLLCVPLLVSSIPVNQPSTTNTSNAQSLDGIAVQDLAAFLGNQSLRGSGKARGLPPDPFEVSFSYGQDSYSLRFYDYHYEVSAFKLAEGLTEARG